MNFKDLFLFTKKGQKISELVDTNFYKSINYSIPLWIYVLVSSNKTVLSLVIITAITLSLILFIHYFSDINADRSKWKILNYAPIWSIASCILVLIIFISEFISIGQIFSRGFAAVVIFLLFIWTMGVSEEIVENEE